MNIHEYQAKALLALLRRASFRWPRCPQSRRRQNSRRRNGRPSVGRQSPDPRRWPRQRQIQRSRRWRSWRRTSCQSVEEAAEEAKKMLGRTLVTHQTGPAGKQVNRIYIEDGSGIETELYLALLVDRQTSRIVFRLLHRGRHGHRRSCCSNTRENSIVLS